MEWSNIAAIAADLNIKARAYDEVYSKKLTIPYKSDEIRYCSGNYVRLMNQIISFLNIPAEEASQYDWLAGKYTCEVGNNIPLKDASAIYNEFYSLYQKYFKNNR